MYRIFLSLVVAILMTGCQNKEEQNFTRFYDDGLAKPVVAICPVIDSTSYELPWSLSEEFTDLVVRFTGHYESLYIPSSKVYSKLPKVEENPFTSDLHWVKKQFAPHEFVVFLEVIEHTNQPVDTELSHGPAIAADTATSSNLVTSLRIRIVDIRQEEPKVVLQEMLHDSYYVTKSLLPIDYREASWGTSAYKETPLSIAHERMAKEVVDRIHDYVLLAKSR